MIKMAKFKDKQRNIEAGREKQLVHTRELIRLSADFSNATSQKRMTIKCSK